MRPPRPGPSARPAVRRTGRTRSWRKACAAPSVRIEGVARQHEQFGIGGDDAGSRVVAVPTRQLLVSTQLSPGPTRYSCSSRPSPTLATRIEPCSTNGNWRHGAPAPNSAVPIATSTSCACASRRSRSCGSSPCSAGYSSSSLAARAGAFMRDGQATAGSSTTSRSLASTCWPGRATTSAITPSRSARTLVSIFIASIVTSTSPRATFAPQHVDGGDRARHRRADVVRMIEFGLATRRPLRDLAAVGHAHGTRLAVQLEEHRARAVVVHVARRHETHDQVLAALEVDRDFLAGLQCRRRTLASAAR
jgi:hypothetical protein